MKEIFRLKKYQWIILASLSILLSIWSFYQQLKLETLLYSYGNLIGGFIALPIIIYIIMKIILLLKPTWFQNVFSITISLLIIANTSVYLYSQTNEVYSIANFIGIIWGALIFSYLFIGLFVFAFKKFGLNNRIKNKTALKILFYIKIGITVLIVFFLFLLLIGGFLGKISMDSYCDGLCAEYEEVEYYESILDPENSSNIICACFDSNEEIVAAWNIPI